MRYSKSWMLALALSAAALSAAVLPPTAIAQEATEEGIPEMDPAAMEAFVAAISPAAPHAYLARYEGEWTYETSMWADPTQPPMKATGEATKSMVMGGRYLQEEMWGEMMGQPFMGRSITGYDNVAKVYRGTWIDNFGTGIMFSEGKAEGDEGGHTLVAEHINPMTQGMETLRMVTRFVDDDHHVFEYYVTDASGKEHRQMVIEYRRAAANP